MNKKFKRILAVVITVILVFNVFATFALAAPADKAVNSPATTMSIFGDFFKKITKAVSDFIQKVKDAFKPVPKPDVDPTIPVDPTETTEPEIDNPIDSSVSDDVQFRKEKTDTIYSSDLI